MQSIKSKVIRSHELTTPRENHTNNSLQPLVHHILIVNLPAPPPPQKQTLSWLLCFITAVDYISSPDSSLLAVATLFSMSLCRALLLWIGHVSLYIFFIWSHNFLWLIERSRNGMSVLSPGLSSPSTFPLAFLHLFHYHKKNMPRRVCRSRRGWKTRGVELFFQQGPA